MKSPVRRLSIVVIAPSSTEPPVLRLHAFTAFQRSQTHDSVALLHKVTALFTLPDNWTREKLGFYHGLCKFPHCCSGLNFLNRVKAAVESAILTTFMLREDSWEETSLTACRITSSVFPCAVWFIRTGHHFFLNSSVCMVRKMPGRDGCIFRFQPPDRFLCNYVFIFNDSAAHNLLGVHKSFGETVGPVLVLKTGPTVYDGCVLHMWKAKCLDALTCIHVPMIPQSRLDCQRWTQTVRHSSASSSVRGQKYLLLFTIDVHSSDWGVGLGRSSHVIEHQQTCTDF